MLRSAAVAVTCAAVALSGAVTASAASANSTPATQTATNPAGQKDKKIPYPRLDAANIVTAFNSRTEFTAPNFDTVVGELLPTRSNEYTGSARRGLPWVYDTNNNRWVNLSSVFGRGYVYDIALTAPPSAPLALTGGNTLQPIRLPNTGDPAGLLRVVVRKADGSIYRSDCTVSRATDATSLAYGEIPLSTVNCTTPTRLPTR
ncbi:hypothetical protein IL992_29940 [Microbispora sp. NEAU-D428]|uniref:hypothetical protein n=1 Tax=Microbispora sitophila TaxID=2771537 RepID=UPI00186751C2|nr:hypothetical protein [Microbispora sitophila]MBE3013370.1 hypothetical protein [Microbispora sitophila]